MFRGLPLFSSENFAKKRMEFPVLKSELMVELSFQEFLDHSLQGMNFNDPELT